MILSDHFRFSCERCHKNHNQTKCTHFESIDSSTVVVIKDRFTQNEPKRKNIVLRKAILMEDKKLNPRCKYTGKHMYICQKGGVCHGCRGNKIVNVFVRTGSLVLKFKGDESSTYKAPDTLHHLPSSVSLMAAAGLTYGSFVTPFKSHADDIAESHILLKEVYPNIGSSIHQRSRFSSSTDLLQLTPFRDKELEALMKSRIEIMNQTNVKLTRRDYIPISQDIRLESYKMLNSLIGSKELLRSTSQDYINTDFSNEGARYELTTVEKDHTARLSMLAEALSLLLEDSAIITDQNASSQTDWASPNSRVLHQLSSSEINIDGSALLLNPAESKDANQDSLTIETHVSLPPNPDKVKVYSSDKYSKDLLLNKI